MKRMRYWEIGQDELESLKENYLKIFAEDITDHTDNKGNPAEGLQPRWERWLQKNVKGKMFPQNITELFVASFDQLCDYYDAFIGLGIQEMVFDATTNKSVPNLEWTELEDIFKYTKGYDSDIAGFFMENSELLGIKTCYYCETAYVNTYTSWDNGKQKMRRQFDVDHFIPKDKCPLLALSLFNFVPSCQVCNSRLKLTGIPGNRKDEYKLFSPSSEKADYEENIKVRLRFWTQKEGLKGRYIHLRTKQPYEKYVQFFRLEDRYEFHKVEAVRLNVLKRCYPDTNVQSIARILHYRKDVVKEDIFHLKYMKEEGRCFEKMTRDVLKLRIQ